MWQLIKEVSPNFVQNECGSRGCIESQVGVRLGHCNRPSNEHSIVVI